MPNRAACVLIDSQPALAEMLAHLRDSPLVAVDTEADSLYVYYEKICLLQFSVPGVDYLVDPLAADVTPVGAIFASPEQEKVFHAAEYDIIGLKRDYGFAFSNLFDTMVAARILGWPHLGLAAILEERSDVHLDKRMQRHNWGKRPLSSEAREYARLDTHFLLDLREQQMAELAAKGRLIEACYAFRRQTQVEPAARAFDPDGFWRIRGARDLTPAQGIKSPPPVPPKNAKPPPDEATLNRYEALRRWRKLRAEARGVQPDIILSNHILMQLARRNPASIKALAAVTALDEWQRETYGPDLLRTLKDHPG